MGYYESSNAEVERANVRVLLESCITALSQPPGCQCGSLRVEVTEHENDATFLPRSGCSRCNLWDSTPRLRRP